MFLVQYSIYLYQPIVKSKERLHREKVHKYYVHIYSA